MSKKDYIAIAQILSEHRASTSIIYSFCNMLGMDNERFDRERFIAAAMKWTESVDVDL